MIFYPLFAALFLALVHLLAGHLRFLSAIPRSYWLSIAGGASVAYVILHLLPELSAGQEVFHQQLGSSLSFIEHHIYLIALVGLTVFYGLERMAKTAPARAQSAAPDNVEQGGTLVFWVHILSFVVYNAIIGYLLVHQEGDVRRLLLFTLAMGLHFLVNDIALQEHHDRDYERYGRWLLSSAVVLGWLTGYVSEVSELVISVLIAFLAGGVILNVLKEELPDERQSRFWAFGLGAAGYALLLLSL